MINKNVINESVKHSNTFQKNKPFKYIEINNFFEKDFLKKLINEIKQVTFNHLNTDLYNFYQSNNLSGLEQFQMVFKGLQNKKNIELFNKITGKKLNKIDMSFTKYQKTNYLLPHNDQLEGRKIAYMIYLSTLTEGKGGELDIFGNKSGKIIIKKIYPIQNKLILFEVSKESFHEVKEILNEDKRYTISGWFY